MVSGLVHNGPFEVGREIELAGPGVAVHEDLEQTGAWGMRDQLDRYVIETGMAVLDPLPVELGGVAVALDPIADSISYLESPGLPLAACPEDETVEEDQGNRCHFRKRGTCQS